MIILPDGTKIPIFGILILVFLVGSTLKIAYTIWRFSTKNPSQNGWDHDALQDERHWENQRRRYDDDKFRH